MSLISLIGINRGRFTPPQSPYLIIVDRRRRINTIDNINSNYPSPSTTNSTMLLNIRAAGLSPAAGTIRVTPSTNLEFSNDSGTTWFSTPQNFAYTGGAVSTGYVYLVRFKSGVPAGTYNETLILEGQSGINISPLVCGITGTVYSQYIKSSSVVFLDIGDWRYFKYNSSDIFMVDTLSSIPANNYLRVLKVAGGAGGGASNGNTNVGQGGGGAGGVNEDLAVLLTSIGNKPVVVGAGGAAGTINSFSNNGSDSSFLGSTVIGGGAGGMGNTFPNRAAQNGGSGGGAASYSSTTIGLGTAGQGGNGGTSINGTSGKYNGGGGGGGGGLGGNASVAQGGNGGIGLLSAIDGNYYGGGGAGASYLNINIEPTGGLGGGGNGGYSLRYTGTSATANSGGGGGGASSGNSNGGAGGSGIVIIGYKFQN